MDSNNNLHYSVLMSVYHKENPEYLRLAMDSMWDQTVPTDDFVLVCDGPLTPELDAVIEEMSNAHQEILHVIRLQQNRGLGHALQIGVQVCKNELIARMDSDDISRPERCEKELAFLGQHPEISIVGGQIEEFFEIDPGATVPQKIEAMRLVPETPEEIIEFAKTRCPFNHPTVMYRKKDVLASGNYQDVRCSQDYCLWVHMLITGFKGYNIQEPFVYMRFNSKMLKRRSGKTIRQTQLNLLKYMRDNKFITKKQYIRGCFLRIGLSLAPAWIRSFTFNLFLRKKVK